MFRSVSVFFLLLLVGASGLAPLGSTAPTTVSAAEDEMKWPRYFEQTGFWVQGPFREYWEQNGGLYVFGYPITGVFMHEDGLYKQYFERAIFEYHPDKAGTEYEVLLQRLGAIRAGGRETEDAFRPINEWDANWNCDFYVETGHQLCHGFQIFWNDRGGLSNFGYPISEEFAEQNDPPPAGDGEVHTVQYFERTRLEWHPENQGTDYEFLLGLLGTEYLKRHGAPADALAQQPKDLPPFDPTTGLHYGPQVGHGFNVAWTDQDGRTLDAVKDAGFSWIRIQVGWRDAEYQPGKYYFDQIDRLVTSAESRGVRVMLSVLKAPEWETAGGTHGFPKHPEEFGHFMDALSAKFEGRVAAYEIWNEQNLTFETGEQVSVERYIRLLQTAHDAVKSNDPNAIVVTGGLSPTGVNDPNLAIDELTYLQQFYEFNGGEAKAYYDVLGVHPGSANNPPDTMWPDNPGPGGWTTHESHYFRRAAQIREVMERHGEGDKQIWLTEFGWASSTVPDEGQEYALDTTEEEQAQYIVRAFEIAKTEWPWMGVMFLWNLNFSVVVDGEDHKSHWSVLDATWSPRPAYEAIKAMPK